MEEIRTPAELAAFRAADGGRRGFVVSESGRKLPVRSPHAAKAPAGRDVAESSWSSAPLPGGPYLLSQLLLFPINLGLRLVTWVCVLYLMSCGLAALTANVEQGVQGNQYMRPVGEMLHAAPVLVRDYLGSMISPPIPPDDLVAVVMVGGGAFVLRKGVRAMSLPRRRRPDPVPIPLQGAIPRAVAVRPSSTSTPADSDLAGARERGARRIAGVEAALAQLDAEWLSYELDLEAYYLTKPVLRDVSVAETAAYRSALYELRSLADALGETSTGAQIAAAEQAADAALMAWGAANDHALAVGVSDRSPTERAALRRLHALTALLADPSTPKPMWSSLVDAITHEMGKLSTVPASWEHLTRVPALEYRNPPAIAAAGGE